MATLLERHTTSQNSDFQRRVKIASLMLAGQQLTSAMPTPPAGGPDPDYEAALERRRFAGRVAADPDGFTPRIAMALVAMSDVTENTSDSDLIAAMTGLFQVYVG